MPCQSPINVDNPNVYRIGGSYIDYKIDSDGTRYKVRKLSSKTVIGSRFKSTLYKIPIPCGWCPDCLRKKQMYLVQRSQGEVIAGNDLFFFTLTYQNKYIPTVDIGDRRFYYVDHSDIRNMFNRIRVNKLLPFDFKYMVVSEYGGKRFRPHLHGIISVKSPHSRESKAEKIARGMLIHDVILSEWRRNVGSKRSPIWQPLCRFIVAPNGHRTFDCHYVEPDSSPNGDLDVAFYVTKYCLKPDQRLRKIQSWLKLNFPYDEYRYYWRLISPHVWFSKFYGSPHDPAVVAHIKKSVNYAISDKSLFPYWLSDGKTFPLAVYYRDRFFHKFPDLFVRFYDSRADWKLDEAYNEKLKLTPEKLDQRNSIHFKRMQQILDRDIIDFFPEDLIN